MSTPKENAQGEERPVSKPTMDAPQEEFIADEAGTAEQPKTPPPGSINPPPKSEPARG